MELRELGFDSWFQARAAADFLATRGRKLPCRCSTFFRHIFISISVEETYAWGQPVFAPLDRFQM